MVSLPVPQDAPAIRTGFSGPAAWEATREAIPVPGAGASLFAAHAEFVDDLDFAGYTPAQILALVTGEVADPVTLRQSPAGARRAHSS